MIRDYLKGWSNYFTFSGRTRRKEFWTFNSINFLIVALYFFLSIYFKFSDFRYIIDIVFGLIGLVLVIPTISSMVRRLHDTSRSGYYLFLGLIPAIGQLILIIFFFQDSSASYNDYGEYPKFKKLVF